MCCDSFPAEVIDKLKFYVYRLIDPRNGETFYVGKGKGDRVFSHASGKIAPSADDEGIDPKMARIQGIHKAGLEVIHVIHRHGMDETTAFEVEAALIDAYPGISNVQSGQGSMDRGVMHTTEIIRLYRAQEACFNEHKILLINIGKSADEAPSYYEAVRYASIINKSNAEQAEFVLATSQGLIVGAFVAQEWLDATAANFPDRVPAPGRLGFSGIAAPADIEKRYVGKRVPDQYRKPGAANPIKYAW